MIKVEVRIPAEMHLAIVQMLAQHNYATMTEFVRDQMRQWLEKHRGHWGNENGIPRA